MAGLLCLFSSLCGLAHAEAQSTSPGTDGVVRDFALLDHRGKFRHLYYHANDPETRAIVLFVQGNGCPLARKRVPELKRLRQAYGAKGVRFWMINANPQDTPDEVVREAAEFGIDQPILLDRTQLAARELGITRTGEAILIEANSWRVRYRGAIDDRLGYESEKPAAQQEHLKDALDAFLAGEEIKVQRTGAPGCVVTYLKGETPSYSGEIAPLLLAKCANCHTPGGIGPFAMSSYQKVRGWSGMIREVLMTRRMPPWQADPHAGVFGNDFSLSEDQARALVQWIDAGAPRGSGPDPLAEKKVTVPEWQLGQPDYVVEIPEQSVAAEGVFDYRYVSVPAPNKEDVWLRGTEIVPGNRAVLHHIIASTIMPGEEREKDQKHLTGYAPGMGPDLMPENTGRLLKAGSIIIFQLHYTASGKAETDRSRLGLYVTKAPPKLELHSSVLMDTKFVIPPGDREFTHSKSRKAPRDLLLYTMNPHMHLRGKSMRYVARYQDGSEEVLLNVPNYRFDWQRNYELKEPKLLPKGTELVVEAAWDNSALNLNNPDPTQEVGWGDQTFNEMFYASFRYAYPAAAASPAQASATSH